MALEDIPVVGPLLTAGADDRLFDAFLLLGPVIIGLIAVFGRSPVTAVLAASYTGGFVGYVAYKSVRHDPERNT